MSQATPPGTARKKSLWRTVKAVAWSFVGLRARGDYEEDVKNLSLLHIIVVGLVGIFVFIAVLVLLVNLAVAR
ncbi:DUF2970 domain-containing protein [Polaromonas sp.]|uniref:DUF2970 domain-containing protein n=1 Tax=Polaromonas sp. TaxID=1869339 RepID=UPI00180EFD39|nr:DUF2970 domain-containing protein [Polaromonas sp.]NML86896.1 DUF2970 domain-containing protein [Polaromonas sp.]